MPEHFVYSVFKEKTRWGEDQGYDRWINLKIKAREIEDPRLQEIEVLTEWEDATTGRKKLFTKWINTETGEKLLGTRDPRLFPEDPRKRGFDLKIFNFD